MWTSKIWRKVSMKVTVFFVKICCSIKKLALIHVSKRVFAFLDEKRKKKQINSDIWTRWKLWKRIFLCDIKDR